MDDPEFMTHVKVNKNKHKSNFHEKKNQPLKVTFFTKHLLLVIEKVNRPTKMSYSLKVNSPNKKLITFGRSIYPK